LLSEGPGEATAPRCRSWHRNKHEATFTICFLRRNNARFGSHPYCTLSQIDNQKSTIYNSFMSGFIQPAPVAEERDSSRWIIAIAVVAVMAVMGVIALLLRSGPKNSSGPPPYAANLKLSDLKMSAAENFVGATVSYVDGTVTNAGDKTVTHALVEVKFRDDIGQLAQREEMPLKVLKTGGPYPEAVDFSVSPLAPGQSQPFRLTFETISAQWNHQYPDIQITDVALK
jgi:hypothetical protein